MDTNPNLQRHAMMRTFRHCVWHRKRTCVRRRSSSLSSTMLRNVLCDVGDPPTLYLHIVLLLEPRSKRPHHRRASIRQNTSGLYNSRSCVLSLNIAPNSCRHFTSFNASSRRRSSSSRFVRRYNYVYFLFTCPSIDLKQQRLPCGAASAQR